MIHNCDMTFYDTVIDHTTLFYDVITQIKPLFELCPLVLLMSFISQKYLIVNLFLHVVKTYNRAIKNMTPKIYILKYVIMYE